MTRVVMFVYNDVVHDARVLREAAALRDAGHEVTIIARPRDTLDRVDDELEIDGIRIVRVAVPHRWRSWWRLVRAPGRVLEIAWHRLTRRPPHPGSGPVRWLVTWRWGIIGWAHRAARAAPPADVYHGHDLSGAVAADRAAARPGARLVYDSHELFMESRGTARQPAWARWFVRRVEAGIVGRADAIVTVNDAVARHLAARYAPSRLVVVHNCPPRRRPAAGDPVPGPLRIMAGLRDEALVLYHGGFARHRGLEELVAAAARPELDGIYIAFLGYGPLEAHLRALVAVSPATARIRLLLPVPPDVLIDWVADADVAVMPIQPSTLNHRLSTPNKLFEALAAGVPVVASDFPEMRRIVIDDPDGPLGAVCDPTDPDAIAAAIRSILELDPAARADLRRRCLKAAHERWNWETESEKLIELYRQLAPSTGSDPRRPEAADRAAQERAATG